MVHCLRSRIFYISTEYIFIHTNMRIPHPLASGQTSHCELTAPMAIMGGVSPMAHFSSGVSGRG